VTTSNTTRDVVIDSTLVVEEVLVDGESTLNWAVGVDLRLDGSNGLWVNSGASLALVLLEVGTIGAG